MNDRLRCLPEITDHVLSGLKADESLKHQILLSAASGREKRKTSYRTVIALCCLSAVLVLLCVFALGSKPAGDIQVIPAGSRRSSPPVRLEEMIDEAAELTNP
jgi:hypothetical protein